MDQISDLEYKEAKNTQYKQQEEKESKKYEDSVRSLWDNFKCTTICLMQVAEGEERRQGIENQFEKIMTENSPNLVNKIDIQVQEAPSPKQDEPKEANAKIHHN